MNRETYSPGVSVSSTMGSKVRQFFGLSQFLLLLLLLLKNVSSARLEESDIHSISPKTPAPQYQPIDRKKRKGKSVEDYSRDRAA